MMHIPLTKPYWGPKEEKAAVRAIRQTSGSGDGPNTAKAEALLQTLTGAGYAMLTTSCTHGMELALAALVMNGKLKTGDEVIVPSYTMSSTANAALLSGAKVVFADIDPVFFNIDPEDIKRKITNKTRGIMIVHYAGMPCRMDEIMEIARRHHLWVVEDAAHAIGASYKDKPLGTFGDIGVYSFHGTKNVSCGEGGAVLTNSKELAVSMEIYRANGTNRKQFLEGVIDKYSWVGKGSSFFLSDILASILYEQLKQITTINTKRQQISSSFTKSLSNYSDLIVLPSIPKFTKPNWHIYAIRFRNPQHKRIFMAQMRKKGIQVVSHYVPLHSAPMGKTIWKGELPVTDAVANTLARLPIYPDLNLKERRYIISSAQKILKKLR